MTFKGRIARIVKAKLKVSRENLSRWAFIGLGVGFLTLLILIPLGSMFSYALSKGLGIFWESISSPEALFSLKFTLYLAIATTAINTVMGTIIAFMLVRYRFPLKGLFDSVIDLPIAIPASVTGFTLLILYGPMGMAGQWFSDAGIRIMFTFSGILIAHVFMTLPYVVRAVGPVLQGLDRRQEEAAKMLGANSLKTFVNVILPTIKGGLIAGAVFTFARSLGEFGATIMVSGNLALRTQTAPLFIFSEFNKGNIEGACAMSVVLIIISFVLFFGFKFITKILEKGGAKSAKRNIH
ncbi:Sulfate transport system permease protein CysT [subsurface metagenome]